jgi:hypothetical protein
MYTLMTNVVRNTGQELAITSTVVLESAEDWGGNVAMLHHRLEDGTFVYQVGTVTASGFFALVTTRSSGVAYREFHQLVK